MAAKPIKKQPKDQTRRIAGGAATASGMNFQAAVTAIAGSHLLLGASLGWLDGLVEDVPTAIWAETAGPGDDVRIELRGGEVLEAQVKRGLSRGDKLWSAMLALATGIDAGTIQYGVLIVSPDTSKTIWTQLASDSLRLGEGRTDNLSEIGQEWLNRLTAASLPVGAVSARLRIHVVHASLADPTSVMMTRTRLAGLFVSATDVERVWLRLYQDAHAITERRGRWEQASLARVLMTMGVQASTAGTPTSVALRVSRWAFDTNRSFSLLGVKRQLSIDKAWIPLKADVLDLSEQEPTDAAAALARYHAVPSQPRLGRSKQTIPDAEWIGRFHTRAVVVGGPGMGKSTLMTRLAHLYARDGRPVLKVSLREIAARLADGKGFEDSVLQLGLDGSGVPIQHARESSLADWVLLCDGLDECDAQQELVAIRIRQFAAGNPRVRLVVTTRPIGYQTGQLSEWRHYELLSPEAERGPEILAKLLQAASHSSAAGDSDCTVAFAMEQLEGSAAKAVISQSPQLLGMAASLLARGGDLGTSKAALYQNLFDIIDAEPNIRKVAHNQPDPVVLARIFDIVGWELIADPLASIPDVLSRSAIHLCADLGETPLRAQSIVNAALKYWQQVGLIEQVRHGTTALLACVHKTFAEFAAARFMWTTQKATERARLLSECLDDYERWSEVVVFASIQMGEEIQQALLARVALGDRQALERALGLLAATPAGVADDTSQHLVQLAVAEIDSNNTVMAYRFGLLLAQMAARLERVIGPLATARLDSSQLWTRRVAWACAVETASFDIDAAQAQLREFLESRSRSASTGRLGGLTPNRGPEDALHEHMALALVRRTLADRSVDRLADLLKMFSGQAFDTLGFNIKVSKLADKSGMKLPRVRRWLTDDALMAMIPSVEYRQAHATATDALLDTLETLNTSFGDGAPLEPSLQLSALLELTGWNESPASDIWWAMKPDDRESMREVLRGTIALSVIHPGQLQLEAVAARAQLREEHATPEAWFLPNTVQVDVPDLDWSRVGSLGLDRVKLEHAALHGPQWLAVSATNLLENLEPPDPRRLAELLAKATGLGMLTASHLARQQGEIGLRLLLVRLDGPISNGFEHLIETLAKTSATWPQVATGLHRAILASNPQAAMAAASLILDYVNSGATVPESLLEEAYQYWLKNEGAYPVSSGIIPDSPRKTLLQTMNRLRPLPDEELLELLRDSRSDVKDLGLSCLVQRATQSLESRSKLVAFMEKKLVPATSVAELLDSTIAFDEADIPRLCDLFSDPDPAYRLAALRLIKPHRMPNAMLTMKLKELMVDIHTEVGRSARVVWDTLATDGMVA